MNLKRHPRYKKLDRNTAFAGLTIAISCLFGIDPAWAQEAEGITSGVFTFKPALGLFGGRNDNMYSAPDSETEASFLGLNPRLGLEIAPGRQLFQLNYDGELAWYDEVPSDDYDDHRFSGSALLELASRHSLELNGVVDKSHEPRGGGLTRGRVPGDPDFPDEPIEFTEQEASFKYAFGRAGAKGRMEFEGATVSREYKNFPEITTGFDRVENSGGAAFYFGFRENAYLVVDAHLEDVIYDVDRPGQPSREGSESGYGLGIMWELTGKTRGRISVGSIEKDFDSPLRPDFSGVAWEVDIRWSPRTYYHFDLSTSRKPQETTGDGDFIDTQLYEVEWTHNWTPSWRSNVGIAYRDEDFVRTTRQEKLTTATATLSYLMRRWLRVEAGIAHRSNDSTRDELIFDGTVVRIGFELAI